ncbi:hypothetical protein NDU88_004305 [Pleurodeles waltl]|uniref:Uncharacterized protein n=1 Tax=Pleurodeles waltl TaxID=8319 RepID=A0AAV7M5Z7_PLEWA|nr:hypothetical protein NDU88_004305 [Pleurodeles waltl]
MTSKGVSSGPSTREVYKSGPPPSPLYISQLRDTDDDDNVSSHEGDVDGSEDPVSYGPLEKRRRISPPDGGDVHLVSHDLVDHAGEPLFDPSFMVHPNSKEWYPSEHVADYVSFFLRHPLDKAARNKLKSECPRPSLPDNITATPVIDPNMLMFFSKFGKDPKKGVDRAWSGCQDKLLDLVGPLTRIFDLAEEAKMDSNPIDPEVLSNWAQRAILAQRVSGGSVLPAGVHEPAEGRLISQARGPPIAGRGLPLPPVEVRPEVRRCRADMPVCLNLGSLAEQRWASLIVAAHSR